MQKQGSSKPGNSQNDINQSCPTVLQEDVTKSMNEEDFRVVKSQQFLPNLDPDVISTRERQHKQEGKQGVGKSHLMQKPALQPKIEVNIINKKGTDFGCEKVESLELSCQDESFRSESLRSRKNRTSEQQIEEPRSGRKVKNDRQQNKRFDLDRDIKQDVLNVLLAGAQDTGKSTFKCCFKKKERKSDETYIKGRTKEIKYEQARADENLLNKRNSIFFIDLAGFGPNQEDKYLRQIQQYATTQWRNYEVRPDEDRRIHCCLYFLRGPRIKDSDINMMKKLSAKFNLIPVISKSDHYTKQEILEMKTEFHRKVAAAGQIYLYDLEQYFLLKLGTEKFQEALHSKFGRFPPFLISSSVQKQSPESGNFVRKYPWGQLQIDNQEHNDFDKLSELLAGDLRTQLLSRLIALREIKQSEVVEQRMGMIGQQVIDENGKRQTSWQDIKGKVILGTLVGAIAAFWYYGKGKRLFPSSVK